MGNPILRDDGVGWRVVEQVARRWAAENQAQQSNVEFDYAALGGLALMERLIGYDRVLLVDAIQTRDGAPGNVYRLTLDALPTLHADSTHDATLAAALTLGRRLGAQLPYDITIIAVEAQDLFDFGEELTAAVAAGVPQATELVLTELRGAA